MSVFFHGQENKHQRAGLSKALMDFYQVKDLDEVFLGVLIICWRPPVFFLSAVNDVSRNKDTGTGMGSMMHPFWVDRRGIDEK